MNEEEDIFDLDPVRTTIPDAIRMALRDDYSHIGPMAILQDEVKRLQKAVENLEAQMVNLSNAYRRALDREKRITDALTAGGMDLEVILATHDLFGDKRKGTYCEHGQSLAQDCVGCGRGKSR